MLPLVKYPSEPFIPCVFALPIHLHTGFPMLRFAGLLILADLGLASLALPSKACYLLCIYISSPALSQSMYLVGQALEFI